MLELAITLVLGLAVGSFLNVLIERCPRMLEREWLTQSLALAREQGWTPPAGAQTEATPPLNLFTPGSHCPHCQAPVRWYHNIPLWGFMVLRGRCRDCGQAISWQYPAVELLTAVWFGLAMVLWGPGVTAWAWMAWGATLIALAVIDARTQYLPDDLTLPLCWAGLLAASLGYLPTDLPSALWGAAAGYTLLWAVAQTFRLIRGQEGMGQGDFKLLAALGAWMGWQSLGALILLASVLGLLHGLVRLKLKPQAEPHFPFGPSLCVAAFALVIWQRGQPVWLVF